MNREDLEMLTKPELIEHAKVQGLELSPLDKKGTMVDKILGEHKEPAVVKSASGKKMQTDAPDIPTNALYDLQGKRMNGQKYRLTIFATPDDKSDVPIIVNGYNIIVKRGHEVVVDEAYINVLRDAVIDTVVQDPDTGARSSQRIMVYPHQAIPV